MEKQKNAETIEAPSSKLRGIFDRKDVIERAKKIYGVITEIMDIAIQDGMLYPY